MTPTRAKKEPRYLEDLTYTVADISAGRKDEFFSPGKFLGMYDEKQIMGMLKKAGIMEILSGRGYKDLVVSVSRQDNYTSRLYVDFDSKEEKETRLIEVVVREAVFRPKQSFVKGFEFQEGLSILLIEWLALQDPRASFTPDKPRLPGQEHPGLGGLKNMQGVLYSLGRKIGKDAIIDIPEYYHAAVIYARLYSELYSRKYSFFSPFEGGQLQAMIRDFRGKPLADVSFAVALDCLLDGKTGEPARWMPSEQVYPISEKLHRYFARKEYKDIVEKTMRERSFTMDWEKYERLKQQGITDEI